MAKAPKQLKDEFEEIVTKLGDYKDKSEAEVKLAYLNQKVLRTMNYYAERRQNNKRKAFWAKFATAILSGLITVLAGFSAVFSNASPYINIGVLLLSAVIATINAWDSFYDHKKLWVDFTNYFNKTLNLKADIEYSSLKPELLTLEQVDNLYSEYDAILKESGEQWLKMRMTRSNKAEDEKKN